MCDLTSAIFCAVVPVLFEVIWVNGARKLKQHWIQLHEGQVTGQARGLLTTPDRWAYLGVHSPRGIFKVSLQPESCQKRGFGPGDQNQETS